MPLFLSAWRDSVRPWIGPAAVALGAWLSIVASLDPGGSYPRSLEGPGLTVDEIFNVQQGVYLVEAVRTHQLGLFDARVLREVFVEQHLPDHPPLGRFWLGLHHQVWWWLFPPADPDSPFVVACARSGSATAFALTVLLAGGFTSIWHGRWAGLLAALAWALLPRAYGHGHLAALETCMSLAYVAAVLPLIHTWAAGPPSSKTAAWTGGLFGLALLTKIQAIFIPIPVVLWAVWHWKQRALRPLCIWGGVAFLVFFAGWPWLWFDPVGHLSRYFGGAANRAELSVWLFGQHYTDRTAPRFYVWLTFLWVMPVKWLVLGQVGAMGRPSIRLRFLKRVAQVVLPWTPRESLLALLLAFPFVLFSLPGVPIYDAERLWLPAAPLFVVFVGRGALVVWERTHSIRLAGVPAFPAVMLSLTVVQFYSLWSIAPVYLSYYGGVTGGLSGAAHRGQERNYWGDAVTRSLLEETTRQIPAGGTMAVSPVLHQFQVEELLRQSPVLRRHGVKLVAYDPDRQPAEYVLLFRRLADLPPELRSGPHEAQLLAEVSRHGVQLAALYRLRDQPRP